MESFDDFLKRNKGYKLEVKRREDLLAQKELDHLEQKKNLKEGQYRPEFTPPGLKTIQNTTKAIEKLEERHAENKREVQKQSKQTIYKIAEKVGKDHPDYPRWLKREKHIDLKRDARENRKALEKDKTRER